MHIRKIKDRIFPKQISSPGVVFTQMIITDFFSNLKARPEFHPDTTGLPSVYDFQIDDKSNPHLNLRNYSGKKLIIVNTASDCRFTGQYADMETLFSENKDKLNVIAFPCNDFGNQETLENAEIADFCMVNFRITFPLFNKIQIKGRHPSPLYYWLRMSSLNGWNDRKPAWNFWKYILNEEGKLIAVLPSRSLLTSDNLREWKIL